MANPYYFKDGSGDTIIPVADADFFTAQMELGYEDGQFYIEFFSDALAQTPVTPTAGTIVARGSPLGNVFLTSSADEVVNAADVQAGDAVYTPPRFMGAMTKAKVTLLGITGATHFRAVMWRHD
jgi:hypothetical protein